jgi:hypothetical protein
MRFLPRISTEKRQGPAIAPVSGRQCVKRRKHRRRLLAPLLAKRSFYCVTFTIRSDLTSAEEPPTVIRIGSSSTTKLLLASSQ